MAVGGGLASGGGVAALDLEAVAPQARPSPPFVCGANAAADVDVVRVGGGRSVAAVDDGGPRAGWIDGIYVLRVEYG